MMIRRFLPILLSVLLFGPAGCDTAGTIAIVPEFEESFGFESGLEGWTVHSQGLLLGNAVDVEHVTGTAASGQGAVRFSVFSQEAGGRVWLARTFQVTAEESYDVTVSYALGTSDGEATTPWDVVGGVTTSMPNAGSLSIQAPTTPETPDGSLEWDLRSHTFVVITGPADPGEDTATVWVGIGFAVRTDDLRQYLLDDIEVSFLRN